MPRAAPQTALAARLLSGYRPAAGVADELFLPGGTLRPVWRPFIDHLSSLSEADVLARFARGDRYLHDAGVFYRKYETSEAPVRDWPLSHIPVLIHDSEWQALTNGLIQRAEVLEALARDLYGPNRLVAEGWLPPALVAQNPGWLRPLVGVTPEGGNFLNFVAFEMGRGPDGKWWVLGDRTEAPSGAGFALENRVATARIFPNFFGRTDVHRLTGFFRAFQSGLEVLRGDAGGRIAILTPGPMNDAYFEHTFIARHLGFLLTEGEDLTVREGRVMVRTVDGLKPVAVLWRRLDAATCDPIELDGTSQIGTPGLVEAVRARGVRMINALGSGVLETRAFLSFLPRISEVLTGAPLVLPNIATWWCGGARERDHVLANAGAMMIGSAFSTRLPFDAEDGTAHGDQLRGAAPERLASLLAERGAGLVGQETVTLSTTPVWRAGGLVPRPMVLRVFLARTREGWKAMPGGYARIGRSEGASAITMQMGGRVGDVWVISDTAVARLPVAAAAAARRRDAEALPARAADNLFWLGRYVERAEGAMRLFRAYFARMGEGLTRDAPLQHTIAALIARDDPDLTAAALARGFEAPLEGALTCGGRVRDRFSVDGMTALTDMVLTARQLSAIRVADEEVAAKVSILLRKVTGFSGLVHENMVRSTGWRFLSLGASLERAANMATILAALADADAPDGALDLVLELGDSAMTHRARYSGIASPVSVIDLLALDDNNPRAILYHLSRAEAHIRDLPGSGIHDGVPGRLSPAARLALLLKTRLAVETPDTLSPAKLYRLRREVWRLSDLLVEAHLA